MPDVKRGRWDIPMSSFHWKMYMHWQQMGGHGPSYEGRPIDLCHYMRVILIWHQLRWFFCGGWTPRGIPIRPWMFAALGIFVGGNVWGALTWPDQMSIGWQFAGGFIGVAVLFLGIVLALTLFWEKYPSSVKSTGRAFAWPFLRIGNGGVWTKEHTASPFWTHIVVPIGDHVLIPVGNFLIYRVLIPTGKFLLFRKLVWRITPIMLTPFLVFSIPFVFSTYVGVQMLWVLGALLLALVGVALGSLALFTLIEYVVPWFRHRKAERIETGESAVIVKTAKPLTDLFRLVGQFLYAKKMGVCPFVIPRNTDG